MKKLLAPHHIEDLRRSGLSRERVLTATDLAHALAGPHRRPQKTATGWVSFCPVHNDQNPSLSITEHEGRILVFCHAGCPQEAVIEALKERGLWPQNNISGGNKTGGNPRNREIGAHKVLKSQGTKDFRGGENGMKSVKSPPGGGPGELVDIYDYRDASGDLLFQVLRYRTPDGKTFRQRRPDPEKPGEWIWNLRNVTLVPYRLPELLAADPGAPVFVTEGEKDADRLADLGLVATTNPGGAGKWRFDYNPRLQGRRVVVLPDNDAPGQTHALKVAQALHGVAASVKIINLSRLPEKGDVSDWLDAGHTADELLSIAEAAPEWEPPAVAEDESPQEKRREKQAELLIKLSAGAELFHDNDHICYATIPVNGYKETWPLRSKGFRRWLLSCFYRRYGKTPGGQCLHDALAVLEAKAQFEGEKQEVYVRIAHHDNNVFIDLCNDRWEVVKISPEGWTITHEAPVKFRRAKGMTALPVPERGGNLRELREFFNLRADHDFILLVAALLAAFSPGPYPILVLQGEQGAAKSTTARLIKCLIDPGTAALRSTPKEVRDLMISAKNSWLLVFDNLSTLSPWLADALCRLSTGGGLGVRELYTDAEECIFEATRPVVLNGIGGLVNRQDLADRSIILDLPPIPDEQRRQEKAFWEEFRKAQPRILGALFDAVSVALKNRDIIVLPTLPRMADFTTWVCAAEPALGWGEGAFLRAYYGNRANIVEMSLEADPVAAALQKFISERKSWEGTATALLQELEAVIPEQLVRTKGWPKAAHALSTRLKRAATFLRAVGIDIADARSKGERLLIIRREKSVTCVQSVIPQRLQIVAGDAPKTGDASSVIGDAPPTEASHRKVSIHAGGDAGDAGDAPFLPYSNSKKDEAGPDDEDDLRGLFIWGVEP